MAPTEREPIRAVWIQRFGGILMYMFKDFLVRGDERAPGAEQDWERKRGGGGSCTNRGRRESVQRFSDRVNA